VRKFIINSKEVKQNCINAVLKIMGDDKMEVIIQKHKKRKTDSQRSYLHVLLAILSDETGYQLGEVKYLVKSTVMGLETVSVGNKSVEVVQSSEKEDRENYSKLIEATHQIAAEAGIVLPSARWQGELD
jgi:hypothetical protein